MQCVASQIHDLRQRSLQHKGTGFNLSRDVFRLKPFRVLRTVSRVADRNRHSKVDSRLTLYKYYFSKCKNAHLYPADA